MKHGPSRLITAQPQYPLQSQGADAMFLASHIPGRRQPDLQGSARLLEDRARRDRALMAAGLAHQPGTAGAIGSVPACTGRAHKPDTPAQPFEIAKTIILGCKPVQKLAPCSREIFTGSRGMLGFAHRQIMTQVELNG